MKITGELKLKYSNSKDCRNIFKSLEIDNKNFMESQIEENEITYKISSKSLGSFLLTVDDLIASEIVTEKIIATTK